MTGKSRYDLALVNNSTERKIFNIKLISNGGAGSIEWERNIPLEGLNDPSRNSEKPHKTQGKVNIGRPGYYRIVLSTNTDRDTSYLRVNSTEFPDNVELSGYAHYNGSTELFNAIIK